MSSPFEILEPTCISFSGGRTSAYMLYRVLEAHQMSLPDDCVVCFANTGKEDEATLKFVHDCEVNWNVPIVWLEYQDAEESKDRWKQVTYETASRNGEPFEQMIARKKYLPNPVARFCTEELKVKVIDKYLGSKNIDAQMTVGIRADEPRRVSKLRARGLAVPLVDAGIMQKDVQSFWKSQPFDLGLTFKDGVTALGNCDLCFLKGPQQILGLVKDKPERAVWWAKMEGIVGATFRSDRPSYSEMHKYISAQTDMFNNEGGIECFCGD